MLISWATWQYFLGLEFSNLNSLCAPTWDVSTQATQKKISWGSFVTVLKSQDNPCSWFQFWSLTSEREILDIWLTQSLCHKNKYSMRFYCHEISYISHFWNTWAIWLFVSFLWFQLHKVYMIIRMHLYTWNPIRLKLWVLIRLPKLNDNNKPMVAELADISRYFLF